MLQDIKPTQKSVSFLYTNSDQSETEIKKTIPFSIKKDKTLSNI